MTDFSKEADSREMEGTHCNGLAVAVAHHTTRVRGRNHHSLSAMRKSWPRLMHMLRPSISRVQFCRPPGRGRLLDQEFNFLNIKAYLQCVLKIESNQICPAVCGQIPKPFERPRRRRRSPHHMRARKKPSSCIGGEKRVATTYPRIASFR